MLNNSILYRLRQYLFIYPTSSSTIAALAGYIVSVWLEHTIPLLLADLSVLQRFNYLFAPEVTYKLFELYTVFIFATGLWWALFSLLSQIAKEVFDPCLWVLVYPLSVFWTAGKLRLCLLFQRSFVLDFVEGCAVVMETRKLIIVGKASGFEVGAHTVVTTAAVIWQIKQIRVEKAFLLFQICLFLLTIFAHVRWFFFCWFLRIVPCIGATSQALVELFLNIDIQIFLTRTILKQAR